MPKFDLSSSSRFFQSTSGLLLLALTAIACLRFYGAAGNDLWQDELVSVYKARGAYSRTIDILRDENQPPLFHFLLKVWIEVFGDGALSVRLPSILCGLLLQLLIFEMGRALFGARTAWWALCLSGSSVALLEFTQEATPYALFWLLCLLGSRQFVRLWRRPGRKCLERVPAVTAGGGCATHDVSAVTAGGGCATFSSCADWALYLLVRAAALYTHYFAVFLLCAEGCWCLLHSRGRTKFFAGWIAAQIALAALFLPWLPVFLEQNRRVGAEFWVPPVSLLAIANAFRQWTLWIPELDHRPWVYISALVCLLYFLLLLRVAGQTIRSLFLFNRASQTDANDNQPGRATPPVRKGNDRCAENALLLFFYLLVPILAAALLSLQRSLFTPKYLLLCAPYYYLLAAHGLGTLRPAWLGNAAGGLIIAAALFFCLMNQTAPGYRNPQYADAADLIRRDWRADDLILTRDSQSFAALDYHLRDANAEVYWWLAPEVEVPFWQGLKGYPAARFVKDPLPLIAARQAEIGRPPVVWLIQPLTNFKHWEQNFVAEPQPGPIPDELRQRNYAQTRHHFFNGVEINRYQTR